MGHQRGASRAFELLGGHRYARLTTFRKNGQPVSTPVWFAVSRERVYVFTDIESGKVKRVRSNRSVTLGPGDFRGRPRGESVRMEARVLGGAESEVADRALRAKYGWQYRLAQAVIRLWGKPARRAFLEIRPLAERP